MVFSLCLCVTVLKISGYCNQSTTNCTVNVKKMTTKCPVEEICEIESIIEGENSEPAPKEIPNLTNLQNFSNQLGKSGTKPNLAIVVADDDDIADINSTLDLQLKTCN